MVPMFLHINVSCVHIMEVNGSNVFLTAVFLVSLQWKSMIPMVLDISVSCVHTMEVNGSNGFGHQCFLCPYN